MTDLRARLARLTAQQRAVLRQRLSSAAGLPLTPTQFGIWLFEQLHPGSTAYHNPAALRIRGPLDVAAVRGALEVVSARHEALRIRIDEDDDGMPVHAPVPRAVVGLTVSDVRPDALDEAVAGAAQRPFDLAVGPLWRADLLRLAPRDHVLVVTFHHLISDGWSLGIVLREFLTAYVGGELPALPADGYARALRVAATPATRKDAALAHWRAVLQGAPEGVPLPGAIAGDYAGGSLVFTLDADTTSVLRAVCRNAGASLFAGVAAVFLAWLRDRTGASDLVVTTAVADRRDPATQNVVGCFLNTVPMRVRVPDGPPGGSLVAATGAAVAEALAFADVPFGEIAAAVGASSRGESAVSNVMVLHANAELDDTTVAGLRLSRHPVPLVASKHDVALLVTPVGATVRCELEYRRGVLTPEEADQARSAMIAIAAGLR